MRMRMCTWTEAGHQCRLEGAQNWELKHYKWSAVPSTLSVRPPVPSTRLQVGLRPTREPNNDPRE
eukprot:9498857-Pyramimonas_sp.AAC.1